MDEEAGEEGEEAVEEEGRPTGKQRAEGLVRLQERIQRLA